MRSNDVSKSALWMCWAAFRPAKMAASLQRFARSAPVRPAVCRAIAARSTSEASGLSRGVYAEDRLPSRHVGSGYEHLPIEAPWPQERRVEVLEPVGRGHDDDLVARVEAVELDEELVQGLVVLAVEAPSEPRRPDRVELVDEDDRRGVLPRLVEELADPSGSEAGEHLDEGRGALRVEVGAGGTRDGFRQERLPRAGRAVEQDPAGHPRAETLEALPVLEELDDLFELGLRLVEPGDV